jgi:predicted nucleic acid-binding Zn ribbon protein
VLKIGDAMPAAVAALLREAPLSPGKVTFAWTAAVGPTLGRATTVALEDRTLVVGAATKQWARELRRSSTMILRRLEKYLGPGTVTAIKVGVAAAPSGARFPAPDSRS